MPEIFPNGQLHVDGWVLEKNPEFSTNRCWKLAQAATSHRNLPILKGKDGGNNLKKGGFTAPVRAQNTEHLSLFEFEADIVQHPFASVGIPDPVGLDRK